MYQSPGKRRLGTLGFRCSLFQERSTGATSLATRLVTMLQFQENLFNRQAAEAIRARIDWKCLLGLELTDAARC